MIYLDRQGLTEVINADSARLKFRGRFTLKDRILIPTFYNLHMGDQRIIPLLVQPGESVTIHSQMTRFSSDYEVIGSAQSILLQNLNRKLARTNKSLDSLRSIIDENPGLTEERLSGIQAAYDTVILSQRRYSIEFVLENINSMAAIYALYQRLGNGAFILNENRDIQLLKITSAELVKIYPESEYVQSLKRDAANMENAYLGQTMKTIVDAAPASFPEIRLPDPGGDTIALSALHGKVILLSFWASWDRASVALNQDFKRLWEKYHKRGLEIYQVSFDNEKDVWTKAIRFDELPWIHVSELSYPESYVASLYNVTEIPAWFLLDRSGEFLGKNIDLVELDRKIAQLVNQN
jgi:peroxiredoxin